MSGWWKFGEGRKTPLGTGARPVHRPLDLSWPSKEFRRLQLIELDMLVEFDRVCRKHGIRYSIDAGTLLGAVRHQGFIPWDDDADIAMLREDYEKFKCVANEMDPGICWLQDHDTDPGYRWGYGKLRRTGTVFVRAGQEHIPCRTGVFIDVFPFDDVPNNVPGQMIQDFLCFCLRKILWAEVARLSEQSSFWRWWFGLLAKVSPEWVFSRTASMIRRSGRTDHPLCRVLLFTANGKLNKKRKPPLAQRYGMPKEWLTDLSNYEFEGHKFMGTRDFHARLLYQYGPGFMDEPPLEQRQGHAPVSQYDFGRLHVLPPMAEEGLTEMKDNHR